MADCPHSDYIPEDLMGEIFSRLPVKSLIRFQSLSKDYATLFKTPYFISQHLHHSLKNPSLLCTTRIRNTPGMYLIQSHGMKEEKTRVDHPLSYLPIDRVIGCCNGLICTYHGYEEGQPAFTIWNPATKKLRGIETPKHQIHGLSPRGVGFGFSPIANDYKIAMLHRADQQAVYSLSTGKWRESRVEDFRFTYFGAEPAVSVDGLLFWSGTKAEESGNLSHCLISFDVDKEVFSKINLPPGIDCKYETLIQLAVYKGSVALLYDNCGLVDVWVADEKSVTGECFTWVKLFTVGPFSRFLWVPFAIYGGEVLVYGWDQGRRDPKVLTLCNPNGNELKDLSFQLFGEGLECFLYAESLVPIDG